MTLPNINMVSSNTLWYLFFTGVKTLGTLAAVMIISRHLNVNDFGTLNFLLSIFMYSVVFESLAHPQIIKKIYLEEKPHETFLKTLYLVSFGLSISALILLSIFSWFIVEQHLLPAFFILISGLIFKTFLPLSYIYDANLKSKFSSFSLCASTLISQLIAILIVLNAPSILYLCLAYGSQPFLHALFLLFFKKTIPNQIKRINFKSLKVERETVFRILKDSFPLFTAAIFIQGISRIDTLMVKHILTYEDYGFFSIAVRLTDPCVLLSSAVCISVFPILMTLYKNNATLFLQKFFKYNVILLGLSTLVIIPVLILSNFTITTLFGTQYSSSSEILNIYIFSIPFLFLHNLQSIWEVIKGLQVLLIYRALFACVTNLVLNYLLIPQWGLKGAAIATVLSYFSLTILSSLLHPKLREYVKIQFNLYKKGT